MAGTTGLGLLAAALLTHLGKTAASSASAARRLRRAHRARRRLAGDSVAGPGYARVESEQLFAYCLPGDGGRIVVSTAAEQTLTSEQLHAVLAHERAHLRGRHHCLVQVTSVLSRAVPVASVRALHREVSTLVELAADDRACRDADREALLEAMLRLGAPRPAGPGLGMNGTTTLARALRLLGPDSRSPVVRSLTVYAGAAALIAMPWALAGVPVALALTGHCT